MVSKRFDNIFRTPRYVRSLAHAEDAYYENLRLEKLKVGSVAPAAAPIVPFYNYGDFKAARAAERWLAARGFSVGPAQGDEARAIMFGRYDISKWCPLTIDEQRSVHAVMEGNQLDGPVCIRLMPGASEEARAAFEITDVEILRATARVYAPTKDQAAEKGGDA